MNGTAKQNLVALVSGVVFGAGLVTSGMTRPSKVLAFLDISGAWDPSLAFVMASALAVAAVAFRWSRARSSPLVAPTFSIPAQQSLDAGLVGGAALFGVGWGLSGYCPGPSIVALGGTSVGAFVFVAAAIAGIVVVNRLEANSRERNSAEASRARSPLPEN